MFSTHLICIANDWFAIFIGSTLFRVVAKFIVSGFLWRSSLLRHPICMLHMALLVESLMQMSGIPGLAHGHFSRNAEDMKFHFALHGKFVTKIPFSRETVVNWFKLIELFHSKLLGVELNSNKSVECCQMSCRVQLISTSHRYKRQIQRNDFRPVFVNKL